MSLNEPKTFYATHRALISLAAKHAGHAVTLVESCAEAIRQIETALFDILGKQTGLSVADLLGGRVRDTIPLSFSIADPDFAADLDRMRTMVAAGNVIYKVKTGVKPRRRTVSSTDSIAPTTSSCTGRQ